MITICMAADNDGLCPTRHKTRHVLTDNGFAENNAAQNIADGAVWRLPHLLEVKFFHTGRIRSDSCAFHAYTILLDCVGGIDCYLVIGGIAVFHAEIIIFQINIEIRQDQLFFDQIPDDARHLIAIEFNNGIGDFYLGHG